MSILREINDKFEEYKTDVLLLNLRIRNAAELIRQTCENYDNSSAEGFDDVCLVDAILDVVQLIILPISENIAEKTYDLDEVIIV